VSAGYRGTLRRMAGRIPEVGESRDEYLRVRLAAFEAKTLDLAREGDSRSNYVRRLIAEDAARTGLSS
jgi:hypothetical protein